MFKNIIEALAHWNASRVLAKKQRQAAAELQAIYDLRKEMAEREAYLLRFFSRLAIQEIDLRIAARRASRQQVSA